MLTNDVASIIKFDRVKGNVATQLGLEDLDEYKVDVTSSTTTRVIDLTVTGTNLEWSVTWLTPGQSIVGTAYQIES